MSYTYEIQRNEEGKISDILVNGKPVKRGSMRGIRKAQETDYWQEHEEGQGRNPFSGVVVKLNALEKTIYEWCMGWYARYSYDMNTGAPIQTYDDMKYFLLELNSQAYMDLID